MRGLEGKKPERVVLVPAPFQGHISPMLDLGNALRFKGFSITVIHTNFNSPNPSNHPEFTFLPINDGITEDEIASLCLQALVTTTNTNSQAPLKVELIKLMKQEGVACIIYDAFAEIPRLKKEGYFPIEDSKLQDLVPGLDPLRLKDLPLSKFEDLESQLKLI